MASRDAQLRYRDPSSDSYRDQSPRSRISSPKVRASRLPAPNSQAQLSIIAKLDSSEPLTRHQALLLDISLSVARSSQSALLTSALTMIARKAQVAQWLIIGSRRCCGATRTINRGTRGDRDDLPFAGPGRDGVSFVCHRDGIRRGGM
jgi:hypothetical protein